MVLVGSLPDCVYPFESSDGVLDVYYFISVNSDMYPFDFDYLCILVIVGLLVCLFVVSVLRCFSTGFCPKLMQLYPVLSMLLDSSVYLHVIQSLILDYYFYLSI